MSTNPIRSRFYIPVLNLLREKAPQAMGVSEIIATILAGTTENRDLWAGRYGGVCSMLCRVSKRQDTPIHMVNGSTPPKFYVEQAYQTTSVSSSNYPTNSEASSPLRIKSIFYKPACEILRQESREMSANEVMWRIIEQYQDLEWSHTQGPIRAMLLSAAKKENSHIEQIPGVLPPRFKYKALSLSDSTADNETAEPEEIMDRVFSQHRETLKKQLSELIEQMKPTPFEHLVNRLVAKILFGESEDTPPSHDGGIDGHVYLFSDPLGLNVVKVQAKLYKAGQNVRSNEIDGFIGALNGKNGGVFVTWSDFSKGAKEKAKQAALSKIVLINGEQLLDYMVKYKVGVREKGISYTLSEIDKDFFDEL